MPADITIQTTEIIFEKSSHHIYEITEMKREIMTGKPTHPGTVLLEDIMKPLNLSVTETARLLGVSRKALSDLINEKSSLSPEMAIRIAKATNTSPESWMNMQQKLTLWTAYQNEQKNVKLFPLTTI